MALVAELKVQFTTDDVSDTTPTWTDVSSLVRSFSISRGRENERDDIEAGTASLVMDNRDRDFDPVANPLIRPLNRWWIQSIVAGTTRDMFFGYAETYVQNPGGGAYGDATTTVACADEMKVLALDSLPAMDPPRDTYADVVLSDAPQGYWRFGSTQTSAAMVAAAGPRELGVITGTFSAVATPIVGDWDPNPDWNVLLARSNTGQIATVDSNTLAAELGALEPGDAGGLSAFTFETWFKSSEATPAAQRVIVSGPLSADATFQYNLTLETTGKIRAIARNSGTTTYTAESASAIAADTWYHLAIVVDGTNTLLYVNGVQQASPAAWTGTVEVKAAAGFLALGQNPAVAGTRYWDEPAFYRYALTADRLLAHYEAGAERGFPAQDPGARITAVLDAAGSVAPRSIRAGSRQMIPTFMRGQSPLEELRRAEEAENVEAVLFIARDGTITFLDDGHRSVSPWNTVQATFDDDGTDTPYLGLTFDYSDSYLANEISATRIGGTLVTSSDAASIADFFKRTMKVDELPITTDADVTSLTASLLAKYKDPLTRITSLHLDTSTAALAAAALARDIGDRIRILHTPPGGGTRIDQTSFVQKIQIEGTNDSQPWRITLAVSPL